MTKPLLTIGMPVYDGQRYVRQALDSLLAQEFQDFELVICDNASTDDTLSICREYAAADPRIRIEQNASNLGAVQNFNKTFSFCTGKYFMWAAHDDAWAPSYARSCIELLEQHAEAVLCTSDLTFITEQGSTIPTDWNFEATLGLDIPARAFSLLHRWGWYAIYGVIRAEALRATSLTLNIGGPDVLLLLQLAFLGPFAKVTEKLFHYRFIATKSVAQSLESINPANANSSISQFNTDLARDLWAGIECSNLARDIKLRTQASLLEAITENTTWRGAILSENPGSFGTSASPKSIPAAALVKPLYQLISRRSALGAAIFPPASTIEPADPFIRRAFPNLKIIDSPIVSHRPNGITVLCVDPFSSSNDADLFVRAAADVAKDFPWARFRFVGAAENCNRQPADKYLIGLGQSLGLDADQLAIVGTKSDSDIQLEFERADLCVNLSPADSFSQTSARALASGCAMIITQGQDTGQHFRHLESALIIPAADAAALAAAIRQLLRDPILRKKLADQAREVGCRLLLSVSIETPVRWLGPIFNPSGYATEALNFILPLADRIQLGIRHHNSVYSEKYVAGLTDHDRLSLFRLRDRFAQMHSGIAISHNPANGFISVPDALFNIGRTMFETDRIPKSWVSSCNRMDEVWVPSQFNVETFANSGVERDKLVVIPGAVDATVFNPNAYSPLPLANRAKFNFLSIFEWSSRKAWDVLLSAYLREFSAEDDVCLHLRTYLFSKPDLDPRQAIWHSIREFAATLGLGSKPWPRIEIIADQIPAADLPRLYLAADCLVAPSRGEGWGRPHHEAMMMGLPVIATAWSGNLQFMTPDNSYLLDYHLVDAKYLEPELLHYRGHRWANPSESHLRHLLRRVQQNPAQSKAVGAKARAHVLKNFSREPVANLIVNRLTAIERQLSTPALPAAAARHLASPTPALLPIFPPAHPKQKLSVAWEGTFLDHGSLSHVNREFTSALKRLPHLQLACVSKNTMSVELAKNPQLETAARQLKSEAPHDVDVTIRHSWPPLWEPPKSGLWVHVQPWEFGSLPDSWVQHLAQADEIWAYSEYVRKVYVHSGIDPQKVKCVPLGIDPSQFHPAVPPLPLSTRKQFKFLFVGGTIHRKGADILLETFLQNFTAADDVCLVIKDFGGASVYAGQTFEAQIKAAQAQPGAPEILYLNEEWPSQKIPALYTACDCLVHPYRGEGFGLPVLEAMASGLPVIVTGGGATDDFAADEFAYRIPAKKISIGSSVSGLALVRNGWLLEPDRAALASHMKAVVARPAEAKAKGQAASAFVHHHWTWQASARIAREHLHSLIHRQRSQAAETQARRQRKAKPLALPTCALRGHLAEARHLFAAKKTLAAWNSATAAIAARPFHPEAFLFLAEIARAAGDSDKERKAARCAQQLAPRWKAAQQFLAALKPNPSSGSNSATSSELVLPPHTIDGQTAPKLTVCLITKNEERFLPACLASIRPIAGQIIIGDTGSSDRTLEIAREFGAEIHSLTWTDDFSAARNAVLEHATGDWILVLDADEELLPDQHPALLEHLRHPQALAFRLPIVDRDQEGESRSYVPRLFRNAPGLFFVGRVHEQIFASIEVRRQEWRMENLLGSATLLHHGYSKEIVRSRGKIARNLRLLERALEELPNEPNLLMNFGLELIRSGHADAGLEQYLEAFQIMSAQPVSQVVPELRETLLTQFATHLLSAQQRQQMIDLLQSPLAKTHGLTASLHFLLGLAHLELKQFSLAAEQMRQCLAQRHLPALAPVHKQIHKGAPHHCLAVCLAELNQPAAAEEAYKTALAQDPLSRPVRFDLARFYAAQNQPVAALRLLHELIQEQPQELGVWQLGAHIALNHPDCLEFACDWLGEAVKVFPNDPQLSRQFAEALLASNRPAEALPLWEVHGRPNNSADRAALVLCQLFTNTPFHVEPPHEKTVSQEFVKWCRRLLDFKAKEAIEQLKLRLPALQTQLPSAAYLLSSAFQEAIR